MKIVYKIFTEDVNIEFPNTDQLNKIYNHILLILARRTPTIVASPTTNRYYEFVSRIYTYNDKLRISLNDRFPELKNTDFLVIKLTILSATSLLIHDIELVRKYT